MAENISAYRLGADALKFLWDQMQQAGPLTGMAKLSPQGIVWAYLPQETQQFQDFKNFEEGGVFDSESASEILEKLVSFVRAFLQVDASHVILCEDRFFAIGDPPNSAAQDLFEWRGAVYHYRTHSFYDAAVKEFEDVISSASDYPLILLLTRTRFPESLPKRAPLGDDLARELAEGVQHVIAAAYDGEGYLIWSDQSIALHIE